MTALDTLGRQRTVLLETRKRDGTWIGTQVSVVVHDGRAYFRTYDASGKAKRLRNFPEVRVTPSNLLGRPTGPRVTGTARLLDDDEAAPVRAWNERAVTSLATFDIAYASSGTVGWSSSTGT